MRGEQSSSIEAVSCTLHGVHFGDITLTMLLESLGRFDVLYAPSGSMYFSRCISVHAEHNLDYLMEEGFPDRSLFLCHGREHQVLLAHDSSCTCVVIAAELEDISALKDAPFASRIIVLSHDSRFFEVETVVRTLFESVLYWESRLDYFLLRRKGRPQFDQQINLSQGMLGNYVCITDNAFNIVACSTNGQYSEHLELYRDFMKHGCLDVKEAEFIAERILPVVRPATPLVICGPDERHPFTTFHYPVYIDGIFLFHVIMVCEHGSIPYLRDMFAKFIGRLNGACRDYWRGNLGVDAPWRKLFNAIIDQTSISKEYKKTQMQIGILPAITQIRLLVFRFDESFDYESRSKVLEASRSINGGWSLPFMHGEELVVVCYSLNDDETRLSGEQFIDSVNEVTMKPFGITGGSSQRIQGIDDLSYGYRQAVTALDYKAEFMRERALYGRHGEPSIVPFDLILKYYLLKPNHDKDLAKFSLEHNILNELIAEDAEKGTKITNMLVSFIGNNLNGTHTAQALHAHRNTVLYHVARIEKRFGFSLKDPFTSQRIMLDYYYYAGKEGRERDDKPLL